MGDNSLASGHPCSSINLNAIPFNYPCEQDMIQIIQFFSSAS